MSYSRFRRVLLALIIGLVTAATLVTTPGLTGAMHGDENHDPAHPWDVEEELHAHGLGQVPLRRGNARWGRTHIQQRHGCPTTHDGRFNARQRTAETLGSPEAIGPQGSARVYHRARWKVVVETAGNQGIITSYEER